MPHLNTQFQLVRQLIKDNNKVFPWARHWPVYSNCIKAVCNHKQYSEYIYEVILYLYEHPLHLISQFEYFICQFDILGVCILLFFIYPVWQIDTMLSLR